MWVLRAERSIIDIHVPRAFGTKKEPIVKARRRSPYDFDRPFHLHFLHCNVKGPPLLRILVRGQKDGRSERRQTGEGEAVPLQKGSFQNPFACSDFGPFRRKGGQPAPYWRQRWTEIGGLEGWLRHPNSGGGVEVRNVSASDPPPPPTSSS